MLATECSFDSPDQRKVCFEKTVTYETISTTDDESRHDSDGLSETTQECSDLQCSNDDVFASDLEEDFSDSEMSGFRTPDPLDFMPWVKVPTAFSETEIANAMARLENVAQQQVLPGAGAPYGMSMKAMPTIGSGPNFAPGTVIVPMPVAMPKMIPVPNLMSYPMAVPFPQQVPVPPGFKLVRIPENKETPEAREAKEAKEAKPAVYSEISDPSKTDRKIFVGGLSPVTTEETLVEYFSEFGSVADAKVIREGEKSKGFAFVQFLDTTPPEVLESVHFIDQRRCGVGLAFQRQR
jgi:hypothetical protein